MKVRVTLSVGDFARFIIAKYFGKPDLGGMRDLTRTRATRAQVRRFAVAALRSAALEQVESMRGKTRAAAERLRLPCGHRECETIAPPDERQLSLL